MASAPYEVELAADVSVLYAPFGETPPDVVTDLTADLVAGDVGNWALLADCDHITEDGIVLRTNTQINVVRSLCSISAVKTSFTAKDLAFEFRVMDTRLEAIALADGQDPADAVTTVGGDQKQMEFKSDPIPQGFSLIFRWDQSGYGDGMRSQIWIPSAIQTGDGGPTWSKTVAWGMQHLWTAQKTAGNPIGRFDEQTSGT